jgi:RND family efflux transporter MFP subunit
VKTAVPERGEIVRFVTLPGTIRANREAVLYAKVAGYLKALHVDKGDAVTAGMELGEIEVPELAAQLAKQRAALRIAKVEADRVSAAREKASDLVTPQGVEESLGRYEIAKAELKRTETLVAYSRLAAPFDGVVTARHVDPGAFIPEASSRANAESAVLELMDFRTVRVQVPVPELEAVRVAPGQPVRVSVESLPGKVFEVAVSRHAYALDPATRTMLVEADVPNADLALRPGMFATAQVGVEKHEGALLLPSDAVLVEKSGASVFLVQEGKAKKHPVKVGFKDGGRTEIAEGLAGGERVIVFGKTPPADGAAIREEAGS